jgi:hypothetical protein
MRKLELAELYNTVELESRPARLPRVERYADLFSTEDDDPVKRFPVTTVVLCQIGRGSLAKNGWKQEGSRRSQFERHAEVGEAEAGAPILIRHFLHQGHHQFSSVNKNFSPTEEHLSELRCSISPV